MKIDLHVHTNHSDGNDSVIELLSRAQKNKVDILSITDHNTMSAYEILKKIDVKKYYSGKILPGIEITTYHKGKVIEILGYGIDIEKMNEYLNDSYNEEWFKTKYSMTIEQLMKASEKLGLVFDKNFSLENMKVGASGEFLKHLKTFKENKSILSKDIWEGKLNFFRDVVNNKKSPFYIDFSLLFQTPKEVIDAIHKCGGKAFLAHAYTYKYKNIRQVLDDMRKLNIDGIECYYALFSKRNCEFLLEYCKHHNLLISAGSDYHGVGRRNDIGEPNKILETDNNLLKWVHEFLITLQSKKLKTDTIIA